MNHRGQGAILKNLYLQGRNLKKIFYKVQNQKCYILQEGKALLTLSYFQLITIVNIT